MKAGAEAHFISGQLFSLGIAAIAVIPRMPFEGSNNNYGSSSNSCMAGRSIGGRLSNPFRKVMLFLVAIGLVRVVGCHLHLTPDSTTLLVTDTVLGTIHVVGQSFLCLTTAYILQKQLAQYINIPGGRPGKSLVPFLGIIFVLAALGSIATTFFQRHNSWCLVNLAEAISCYPVLQTLQMYTSVTAASSAAGSNSMNHRHNDIFRGPILTQMLTVTEIWYFIASALSFVAEAFKTSNGTDEERVVGATLYILFQAAVGQHHDTGVSDWTRLLMHSVFLNSIDELQHMSPPSASTVGSSGDNNTTATTTSESTVEMSDAGGEQDALLVLRRRTQYESGGFHD